jgi:hypothetical protein
MNYLILNIVNLGDKVRKEMKSTMSDFSKTQKDTQQRLAQQGDSFTQGQYTFQQEEETRSTEFKNMSKKFEVKYKKDSEF